MTAAEKRDTPTADWFNALGTGANRALIGLVGLPMDTARNIVDLNKAAYGTLYSAGTKKLNKTLGTKFSAVPPDALTVGDRADVPLTGAALTKAVAKTKAGDALVNPVDPEYQGGYTQAAGGALASSLIPYGRNPTTVAGAAASAPVRNLAANVVANETGTLLGKGVGDATGSEALGIAAGMSPSFLRSGGEAALKYAVRGGEKGRQNMVERMQALKDAGVTDDGITLGLASGNKSIGALEGFLSTMYGSSGVLQKAAQKANAGIAAKNQAAIDEAKGTRSTDNLSVGEDVRKGLEAWRAKHQDTLKNRVYTETDRLIPPDSPVKLTNTLKTLGELNATAPILEQASRRLLHPEVYGLGQDLKRDLTTTTTTPGTAPGGMVVPPEPLPPPGPRWAGSGGLMNTRVPTPEPPPQPPPIPIPGGSPTTTTTMGDTAQFSGTRRLRTLIGSKLTDNPSNPQTIPRDQLDPLYKALSDDMKAAAAQADAARGAQGNARTAAQIAGEGNVAGTARPEPGSAEHALEVQNRYFRQGQKRLEQTNPLADKNISAEQALERLLNTTKANGGNIRRLNATQASLDPETRGQLAAHWMERAGATDDGWSNTQFKKNWDAMSPEAREVLLAGFASAPEMSAQARRAAEAAGMMKASSGMWKDPEGPSHARPIRSSVGAATLGAGAFLLGGGLSGAALAPLAGVAGSYTAGKLLTNKGIINAMARQTGLDERTLLARISALRAAGELDEPPRIEVRGTSTN